MTAFEREYDLTDVVVRLFRAVDRKSWHDFDGIFDPEIVYERPGYDPLVGMERLLHFYQHERVLASGQHHLDRVVADETHAACWGQFIGYKKDGTAVSVGFADTYRFENGKIKERRSYFYEPSV